MNLAVIVITSIFTVELILLIVLVIKKPKDDIEFLDDVDFQQKKHTFLKKSLSDNCQKNNIDNSIVPYITAKNFYLYCDGTNNFGNENLVQINEHPCILLNKDNLICGRSEKSDIIVNDNHISRVHFVISIKNGICTITDCNSTNGTFVNGKKILKQYLSPGDSISIGQTTMKFCEQ